MVHLDVNWRHVGRDLDAAKANRFATIGSFALAVTVGAAAHPGTFTFSPAVALADSLTSNQHFIGLK